MCDGSHLLDRLLGSGLGFWGVRRGEPSGVGGCPGPEVTQARPGLTSCHSMTPLHARNLLLTIWTGPATPPGPTAWGGDRWAGAPRVPQRTLPRPLHAPSPSVPSLSTCCPQGPAWPGLASSLPTGPEDSPERALPLRAPPPCPGPSPRHQPGGHGSQGLPLRTGRLCNLPHKRGHFWVKGSLNSW